MNLPDYLRERAARIDAALDEFLPPADAYPAELNQAMRYSVFAGGKRLRPILTLAAAEAVGGSSEDALPAACAVEIIHTYSLIHDDLPAMDNDDFRRGLPTNHKVFGEGIAILSGDALLNFAFETMLDNALLYPEKLIRHVKAINTIARAAGVRGMIGGQVIDLQSEGKVVDGDTLKYIHDHKTGALFMASISAAIILENPPKSTSKFLIEYGKSLGLAFQIIDDILDVVGDIKDLGKGTGRDKDNSKTTYVEKYGLEKSWSIARELSNHAIAQLDTFGLRGEFLRQLANFIVNRRN